MTSVALRKGGSFHSHADGPTRDEVLARYLRLREISRQHNSAITRSFLPRDALMHHARKLGLMAGKTLVLDSMDDLNFATDLAVYTAPPGRSRAIDRYARSAELTPGSDEALVLEAMRRARFAIVVVERRHEAAGLIVRDLIREEKLWLMDVGWESSFPDGAGAATRLYTPETFSMTAGVGVPLEPGMADAVFDEAPHLARKEPREAIDDRRFAEALYRVALARGVNERMIYQEAEEGLATEPPSLL